MTSCLLFMEPIGSYFAVTRTALVREAAMCLFFRLARRTDAGGSIRSERRTFIPLSIGVRALNIPRSFGLSGEFHSITGASGERGMSVEGSLHTHEEVAVVGWLLDVE